MNTSRHATLLRALAGASALWALTTFNPLAAQTAKPGDASAAARAARSGNSETLGVLSYNAPPGWKRKGHSEFVSFETINAGKGTWSVLGIYRDRPGTGDAGNDFSTQWNELVTSKFNAPAPNEVETTQLPSGYTLKVGGSQVNADGAQAAAILVVASGYGVAISALFLTNTNDTVPVFDKFIQTAVLNKPDGAQQNQNSASPAMGAKPVAGGGAVGGARPGNLVGTWVRAGVSGPALYNRNSGAFAQYATGSGGQLELKANGEATLFKVMNNSGMCDNGIATDRRGTWSVSGGVLTFNFTQGSGEIKTCGKVSKTTPKLGIDTYYIEQHDFQGVPQLGLSPDPAGNGREVYSLHNR
jgi:hypothetical protein